MEVCSEPAAFVVLLVESMNHTLLEDKYSVACNTAATAFGPHRLEEELNYDSLPQEFSMHIYISNPKKKPMLLFH